MRNKDKPAPERFAVQFHILQKTDSKMRSVYFAGARKIMNMAKQWVRTDVPAIMDIDAFEKVRAIRQERAPQSTAAIPKIIASPVMLAGLIKCEHWWTSHDALYWEKWQIPLLQMH